VNLERVVSESREREWLVNLERGWLVNLGRGWLVNLERVVSESGEGGQ